jgi:hypothetical protein
MVRYFHIFVLKNSKSLLFHCIFEMCAQVLYVFAPKRVIPSWLIVAIVPFASDALVKATLLFQHLEVWIQKAEPMRDAPEALAKSEGVFSKIWKGTKAGTKTGAIVGGIGTAEKYLQGGKEAKLAADNKELGKALTSKEADYSQIFA